jgi:hypothetical protein
MKLWHLSEPRPAWPSSSRVDPNRRSIPSRPDTFTPRSRRPSPTGQVGSRDSGPLAVPHRNGPGGGPPGPTHSCPAGGRRLGSLRRRDGLDVLARPSDHLRRPVPRRRRPGRCQPSGPAGRHRRRLGPRPWAPASRRVTDAGSGWGDSPTRRPVGPWAGRWRARGRTRPARPQRTRSRYFYNDIKQAITSRFRGGESDRSMA